MKRRQVTASAKGPTGRRSKIGSGTWPRFISEAHKTAIGLGKEIGNGSQWQLVQPSITDTSKSIITSGRGEIGDSAFINVIGLSGERWGNGRQWGHTEGDVIAILTGSSGPTGYMEPFATRVLTYTQMNDLIGNAKKLGLEIDITVSSKGPILGYQTRDQYSAQIIITKLTGAVNE